MITGSPKSGRKASRVRRGLIVTIAGAIRRVRMLVSTRYMSAGPATMRTASRSLVVRAITSPVGYRS